MREGFDAILRALSDRRAFADDDVAFLWPHIRRRTEAGVSEGDMLAVVRLFQRAVWDAITELAGDGEDGRAAALILARPLIDYIDVLSRVVDRAFVEAEEAISSRTSAVRQEVVDILSPGGASRRDIGERRPAGRTGSDRAARRDRRPAALGEPPTRGRLASLRSLWPAPRETRSSRSRSFVEARSW